MRHIQAYWVPDREILWESGSDENQPASGFGGKISNMFNIGSQLPSGLAIQVTRPFQLHTNSHPVVQSIGQNHRVVSSRIGTRIGCRRLIPRELVWGLKETRKGNFNSYVM